MVTGRELEPGMGAPAGPPLVTPVGAWHPLLCLHTPFPPLQNNVSSFGGWEEASRGPLEAGQVPACLTIHSSLCSPESVPRLLMSFFAIISGRKGLWWQLSPGE